MTATEILRRLLDERGVEHEGETDEDGWAYTRWHGFDDTGWLAASDELCGLLDLRGRYLFTPAQAIAATLGPAYEPPVAMHWNGDVLTLTIPRDPSCIRVQRSAEQPCKVYADESKVIAATLGPKVTGNTSDGYHTFNELYHHRAVLFSVIVRDHRELAWKSMRHHDGTMYDGMFIVGIETPEGQATYHYDIDPYWDMFNCKELDQAPEWDGHTPSEAIERIATLDSCNCSNNCTNGERTGRAIRLSATT